MTRRIDRSVRRNRFASDWIDAPSAIMLVDRFLRGLFQRAIICENSSFQILLVELFDGVAYRLGAAPGVVVCHLFDRLGGGPTLAYEMSGLLDNVAAFCVGQTTVPRATRNLLRILADEPIDRALQEADAFSPV